MSESHLLEELSELEHDQWVVWTQTLHQIMMQYFREGKTLEQFIGDMTQRWEPNWVPYKQLDWETKEFDREWSRQVLGIIRKYLK